MGGFVVRVQFMRFFDPRFGFLDLLSTTKALHHLLEAELVWFISS